MKTLKVVSMLVCVVFMGACTFVYASQLDQRRAEVADCVIKTAKYNRFSGNIYGPEAWNIFVGECE